MSHALLQTLVNDPTRAQIAGGMMMIILFLFVGLVTAIATTVIARRVFQGRYERVYWAVLLAAIAAIYLGFAGWFQASPEAWTTELTGIVVFAVVAVIGAFSATALAFGYLLHGLWDVAHSLLGTDFFGHAASSIPLGYDMFCLGFDFAAAAYLAGWPKQWDKPGRFNPRFWRDDRDPSRSHQGAMYS
jgi:hypothetical protein